jgi:CRP-like cAMP-binding protein
MSRSGGTVAMVGRVFRTSSLRRIQLGYLTFSIGEHATSLAVLVFALQQGGPHEVGLVAVALLVPGIVLAPFAAFVGDRFAPQRALAFGLVAQALAVGGTAAAMAFASRPIAYAFAAVAAATMTFTRPAMASVLPVVTHSPAELVAANVVSGLVEQAGVVAGPLAAAAIIAVASPTAVYVAVSAALVVMAIVMATVRGIDAPRRPVISRSVVVAQVLAGFAILGRERRLRTLVLLGAGAGVAKGAVDVLFVTFADASLPTGDSASGWLAGGYGVGALVGALVLGPLSRTGRASSRFVVAGVLVAVPFVLLTGVAAVPQAVVTFGVIGAGKTLLQLLSAVTVQRETPIDVTARVFGVLEGLRSAAKALGALTVMLLTEISIDTALASLAALLAVALAAGVVSLRRHAADLDRVDQDVVDRLLADPVLAPLPATSIERLAREVGLSHVVAGTAVVREGDPGDRYYLVVSGALDVRLCGNLLRTLDAGHSFGEVALLRDVPRTATVTAVEDCELLWITRAEFLTVVTGHPPSLRAVGEHVDTLRY